MGNAGRLFDTTAVVFAINEELFEKESFEVKKNIICTVLEELLVKEKNSEEVVIPKDYKDWIGEDFLIIRENTLGNRIFVKRVEEKI